MSGRPRALPATTILAVAALLAAACGDSEATTTTAAPAASPPPATAYEGFRDQPTACDGATPSAVTPLRFAAPGDMGIDPSSEPTATITTSCGDIVVALDPGLAPETVNSFAFLASEGYFDGSVAHRIVAGFVLQAGDPTATGLGNPGYVVPDEFPPDGFRYERGVVAMANAGPGTTGSQFFIVLGDTGLSPQFTAFGRVVAGFEVLDAIAAIPVAPGPRGEASVPLRTLYLERITVEAG
jgi:peptidyl-prolyl cis-trans isomerase B (cyclophilin B)